MKIWRACLTSLGLIRTNLCLSQMKIWPACLTQISWSNKNKSLSFSNENMAGLSEASFVEPRLVSKMSANVFPQINREHNWEDKVGEQVVKEWKIVSKELCWWKKHCMQGLVRITLDCIGESIREHLELAVQCLSIFFAIWLRPEKTTISRACYQNPFRYFGLYEMPLDSINLIGFQWILSNSIGSIFWWGCWEIGRSVESVEGDFPIWKPTSASACLSFHKSFFIGATNRPSLPLFSKSTLSSLSQIGNQPHSPIFYLVKYNGSIRLMMTMWQWWRVNGLMFHLLIHNFVL